jgi:serine/threonine-protein kinase HipA
VAARATFWQVCLAWLTGNGDVQAKSMSVLATAEGQWRLALMYDVPSTLACGDHFLALNVGVNRDDLLRRHLLAFADRWACPLGRAEKVPDEALCWTENLADALESARPAGLLTGSAKCRATTAQQWQDRHAARP